MCAGVIQKKNRKYGLKNARESIVREARESFGVKQQPGENKKAK